MRRKQYFWWLIAAEIMVLLLFLLPFFQKCDVYEYDFRQMESWTEYGEQTDAGWLVQAQVVDGEGYEGIFTYNPFFDLRRGSYDVTVNYRTDSEGNVAYLGNNSRNSFGAVLCDKVLLSPNKNRITFQAYLKERVALAHIITEYKGGNLLVSSVTIQRTRDMDRAELVTVLFFITLLNVVLHIAALGFFRQLSGEQITVALILSASVLYLFYPFMTNKLITGTDMVFHLLRIESIRDGWIEGDFFAKVHSAYLEGYGYASGVFYPEVLLYFPALLRLIGFSVQGAYKIYLFAVNIATCISMYLCMEKLVRNRYISAFGTILYLYVPFRLFGLYFAHTVGASGALIFLPMILLGLYEIYTEDITKTEYRYRFVIPAVGFAGLLGTHILTTEMAGAFTILACVIFIRKTLKKERFWELLKTLLCALVLSAGFLVPFVDYYLSEDFKINAQEAQPLLQSEGFSLSQIMQLFPAERNNETFTTGFNLDFIQTQGVAVLIMAAFFMYVYLTAQDRKDNKMRGMAYIFWNGIAALVMATCYFPWDIIRKVFGEIHLDFLINSLQYSMRFMEIAPLMLIVPGCYGLKVLLDKGENRTAENIGLICLAVVVISSGYLVNHALNIGETKAVYDLQQFTGRHTWSQEEYLPKDTDESYLTAIGVVPYDGVETADVDRGYLSVGLRVINKSESVSGIDVPLLYYRGYRAVSSSGERLTVRRSDNNNVVYVEIPPKYEGTVRVWFEKPVPWKAAQWISVIAAVILGIYFCRCFRKGVL